MSAVSVIIPTLNEAQFVAGAVRSAMGAGAHEVIVSDGGSTDMTAALAREAGARVLVPAQMRAKQLNEAARMASGDVLLFLHADTLLPSEACSEVDHAISAGAIFGGFSLRFRERSARLRVAAMMINARTRLTLCPWGDQAQFIAARVFFEAGGFREIPIMEDYDLAVRMKRRGRTVVLRTPVVTSGRRFLERGVIRTAFTNWRIIRAFHRGIEPTTLAAIYRAK